VIEAMRWAAAEEAKVKAREIEMLREDIHRLNASREEMLESQRHDLTQTFEQLLRQRDETLSQKERDIVGQISLLENKLESLLTENTRLKGELQDAQRRSELMNDELTSKEEQIRQLTWRLDDERSIKQRGDDILHRQLQQTVLELTLVKEANDKRDSDHHHALEKVKVVGL